ncbi:MAG: radical SAM protein [bacterium]
MGLWVVSKRHLEVGKLKLLLENAVTTRMVREGLTKNRAGKTRIEEVLDCYGRRDGMSLAGKARYYPLFKLLDLMKKGLDWDEETFLRGIRSPTTKRLILNIFQTVQKYGVRMPQVFASPLMVVWNYTYRCNLKCRHCYQDAGSLGREHMVGGELSTEERLQVVDQIASYNIPTLSFSGGEPFIEKDIWEVAGRAKECGLYISANSNGTLINREVARKLRDMDFAYVAVSVDAADSRIHDAFRGVPGMWELAVQGIRNLVDVGMTTCISFTMTNYNYDQLSGLFKLREKLGAYKVIVYNFIPTGRGDYRDDPTPEMREAAYKMMFDEIQKGNHVVATTAPQFSRFCKSHCGESIVLSHIGEAKAREIGVVAELVGGCGVARCYIAVQPDGNVTPCVYMPDVVIGNLNRERLGDIWEKSELLESMRTRDELWGHCSVCDDKMLCGGCRARAHSYYGDMKAPDPGCIKNRAYISRSKHGAFLERASVAASS